MKNSGIRIETVKEVNSAGDIGYRVTSIKVLPDDQLPKKYLGSSSKPVVYLDNEDDMFCKNCSVCWVELNKFYSASNMKKINVHIREAGQYLADVNRELAKERAAWNGKVTFVDGVVESAETVLSEKAKPESILEKIPRLWATGKLYFIDDDGVVRPFPKPEVEVKK